MHFNNLKQFLESGLSQKQYAISQGISITGMADRLTREMKRLLNTNVIEAKRIVGEVSIHIDDVKRNRVNWLKAIEAYDQTMCAPVDIKTDNRKISELTVSEFVGVMMKVMGGER
jgi:hypothetical protein